MAAAKKQADEEEDDLVGEPRIVSGERSALLDARAGPARDEHGSPVNPAQRKGLVGRVNELLRPDWSVE